MTGHPEAVHRMAKHLQAAVRAAGWTQRAVEQELRWGQGYLSQLLGGRFDLKVRHVYQVLEVIGQEPRVFFRNLDLEGDQAPAPSEAQTEQRGQVREWVDARVGEILAQWRETDPDRQKRAVRATRRKVRRGTPR